MKMSLTKSKKKWLSPRKKCKFLKPVRINKIPLLILKVKKINRPLISKTSIRKTKKKKFWDK